MLALPSLKRTVSIEHVEGSTGDSSVALESFVLDDGERRVDVAADRRLWAEAGGHLASCERVYAREAAPALSACWVWFGVDLWRTLVGLDALETALSGAPVPDERKARTSGQSLLEAAQGAEQEVDRRGLGRAADVYIRQTNLAHKLERAGICWDEQAAEDVVDCYNHALLLEYAKYVQLSGVRDVYRLGESDLLRVLTASKPEAVEQILRLMSRRVQPISRLLLTPRMRLARLLSHAHRRILDGSADYPVLGRMLGRLQCMSTHAEKVCYLDRFRGRSVRDLLQTAEERLAHREQLVWVLRSSSNRNLTPIYEMLAEVVSLGEDGDWFRMREVEVLYRFRRIRRLWKLREAVLGAMGRGSVWHREAGSRCMVRGVGEAGSNFQVVRQRPNATVTKRWISALHAVPARGENNVVRSSRWRGVRVTYDFAQHELRVLAMLSGSERLMSAGDDFHRRVAADMLGKRADQINEAERRTGKAVFFSVLYGMGDEGLARTYFRGNLEKARAIRDDFFRGYPDVVEWMRERRLESMLDGCVKTMWGDKLVVGMPLEVQSMSASQRRELARGNFPGNMDAGLNSMVRSAFRNAVNYPVQSAASSIAALSVHDLVQRIEREDKQGCVDAFTHDSCDIDVALPDVGWLLSVLSADVTERVRTNYGVPVKIDVDIGVDGYHRMNVENYERKGDVDCLRLRGDVVAMTKLVDRWAEHGATARFVEKSLVDMDEDPVLDVLSGKGRVLAMAGRRKEVSGELMVGG